MKLFVAAVMLTVGASAQVVRVGGGVRPHLTLGNSLTVTCSPCSVSFNLVQGGMAVGNQSVSVTMTWSGVSLVSSSSMYAYFASASQALSMGSWSIPSSLVLGQVTTGTPTSFTAFTQTGAFGGAGAGLLLYSTASLISLGGTRTDSLSLEIDLTSRPNQEPGVYTGVLYLQAQEF